MNNLTGRMATKGIQNPIATKVELTAAQIAALTPPADVGGFATSDNQTNGNQITKVQETSPVDVTKVNASIVLSNTDPTVASTKTITKTIGAAQYLKTLSLNAGGDVIQVSAWSLI